MLPWEREVAERFVVTPRAGPTAAANTVCGAECKRHRQDRLRLAPVASSSLPKNQANPILGQCNAAWHDSLPRAAFAIEQQQGRRALQAGVPTKQVRRVARASATAATKGT